METTFFMELLELAEDYVSYLKEVHNECSDVSWVLTAIRKRTESGEETITDNHIKALLLVIDELHNLWLEVEYVPPDYLVV